MPSFAGWQDELHTCVLAVWVVGHTLHCEDYNTSCHLFVSAGTPSCTGFPAWGDLVARQNEVFTNHATRLGNKFFRITFEFMSSHPCAGLGAQLDRAMFVTESLHKPRLSLEGCHWIDV